MADTRTKRAKDSLSDADKKKVELVLEFKDRFVYKRWIFEREWYRNILFYVGQQWITYEDGSRRWRLKNMPAWVPMPVTNRLASTVNSIRSSVAQVVPAFDARPSKDDEKSVLTAHAADHYLDVILDESGFRGMRRRLASWLTMCGNAFIQTEFDTSPDTGTVFVPGEACAACGTQLKPEEIPQDLRCPNCGSDELNEDAAVGSVIPQGMLRVRCLSPFEVYVDHAVMEMEDQPAVLVVETKPLEIVKQTWNNDDVTSDTDYETGRQYLNSLNNITGSGFSPGLPTSKYGPDNDGGTVTLYRLYCKTHKDYPDGFYAVMSGDQTILEWHEPFPFRFLKTNKPFYPVIHCIYDDVPGRFWGKTPVDDLVPKQRQRNEIESLYQTIVMRCSNPVWLMPTGVQTTPITGDPGIVIRYSGTAGMKPERLQGVDAPESVIKFITQIDQDFEEIANTFAAMKGKQPGSVRAASAIQMLIERGFGRYGSVFDNLEESYERWAVQALELWRQKAVFPRVQAVSKAAVSWQFIEFLGSDLGDVDIRVEAGSTRPKSAAGRQMLLQQMFQMGAINMLDPEQRIKVFEEMGAQSLLPGADADIKVVAEENAKFMAWANQSKDIIADSEMKGIPPLAMTVLLQQTFPLKGNPILDHHPTHLIHHRRFGQSEEFRALPEALQQMYVMHMVYAHYLPMMAEGQIGPMGVALQMVAQEQAPGQAGQNGKPGGGAQKTAGPGAGSNEDGMTSNKGSG